LGVVFALAASAGGGPQTVPAGSGETHKGITEMTISAKPELVVAHEDEVYVFDVTATWPASPLRTIPHVTGTAIVSLAIGR
jgi:hypothetical protein